MSREVVRQFFEAHPQWKADANISFLIEQSAKPLSIETLLSAALVLRDKLLLAPEYEDAWQDYKFYHPGETGLAHRAFFIEQLREKEVRNAASKEYETLITQLGEKFRGQGIERLREVAEKRRVHGMTASEFREERAAQAPKEVRKHYDGFITLPDSVCFPGDIQATHITPALLQALPRVDYWRYRWLCKRYGMTQISDRQQGA